MLSHQPTHHPVRPATPPGEFGEVRSAILRPAPSLAPLAGQEQPKRVAVKLLRPQAGERAKLDFLVEATLLSQLEHPNVVRLEALVSRSEPAMIVTELLENGPLDSYLRVGSPRPFISAPDPPTDQIH